MCYNGIMKHKRSGFTLIEIVLFLGITGLLFVGIIVGTNNSIFQQRFMDSVQNFAEFLRSIYSEVSNPQSVGDGRSDTAIYGKLIVFGQTVGLDGVEFEKSFGDSQQRIYVYDVIGDVVGTGTGNVMELLGDLNANVAVLKNRSTNKVFVVDNGLDPNFGGAGISDNNLIAEPAGIVQSYIPRWGSSIEKAYGEKGAYDKNTADNSKNLYKGAVLVVRHPDSGTINTLILNDDNNETISVNETISEANANNYNKENNVKRQIILRLLLNNYDFNIETVNFCVNPYGVDKKSNWRRDVRLVSNARNASGVEIIDMDDENNNVCRFDPHDE